MIIPYQLYDGRIIDVDVSPEVAAVLEEHDRIEASWQRKARRRRVLSVEALGAESAWEPANKTANVVDDYIKAEQQTELSAAVEALPAEQRDLINNFFFLGYSVRAIAEQQGFCFQAVYKRLNKMLDGLRQSFAYAQ